MVKTFKPPKVIYIDNVVRFSTFKMYRRHKSPSYCCKYVRANEEWKKAFRKRHPMLCSKEAGVIGFIEKEVLGI